jgi:hypothetical protein
MGCVLMGECIGERRAKGAAAASRHEPWRAALRADHALTTRRKAGGFPASLERPRAGLARDPCVFSQGEKQGREAVNGMSAR